MLPKEHRGADQLMACRSKLQRILSEASTDRLVCRKIPVASGKFVYHVQSAILADQVREEMRGLLRLKDELEKLGVDFTGERGLWLPMVADAEEPWKDNQINVTRSPNWATHHKTASEILEELDVPQDAYPREDLAKASVLYREFRCCRRSGHYYRVAVRGPQRNQDAKNHYKRGLETKGMNDFAVVLGDMPINLPPLRSRARKTKSNAWRGVEKPLFEYQGRRGAHWMVYPPAEGE